MLYHIIHVIVTALAVLIAAKVVPGIRVRSFGSALFFALVLGVLSVLLKWILVLLALPLIILTLGLFMFVINAFLFWLADKLVEGVEVDGFGSALLGSMFTSAVTIVAMWLLRFL